MKTIQYNNNTYYVNGLSGELKQKYNSANNQWKESILFNNSPVFIYNHKNFQEDPIYLSDAVSILTDLIQPSESKVRSAMIWSIGYGEGDMSYSIKSGGDNNSESHFSSSLSIEIAHPTTGEDTRVVIMKKYSKNFNDVLITEKEIRDLYKLCSTPKEKELHNDSQMEGGIYFLIKIKYGHKVNVGGKKIIADQNLEEKFKQLIFENSTPNKIEKHIDSMIKHREYDLTTTLMEGSSSTTEEFHEQAKKHIKILMDLKNSLLIDFKKQLTTLPYNN